MFVYDQLRFWRMVCLWVLLRFDFLVLFYKEAQKTVSRFALARKTMTKVERKAVSEILFREASYFGVLHVTYQNF